MKTKTETKTEAETKRKKQLKEVRPPKILHDFFDMISMQRGYQSEAEIFFNEKYLDDIPGMQQDAFGNRFCVIGKEEPKIMFACHTDTVHRGEGLKTQTVYYDSAQQHAFVDGKESNCLGADDTTGVWLCLQMIKSGISGLYVFHRGEEAGCVGSEYIAQKTPEFVDNIDICISLDRMGTSDVITHQMGSRCASDSLAYIISAELNKTYKHFTYQPCDMGVYTDSMSYEAIIPECLNISVGYYQQHSSNEYQDLRHMLELRKALIKVDWQRVLANVTRKPGEDDPITVSRTRRYDFGNSRNTFSYSETYDYIVENPEVIAELLQDINITEEELMEYEYDVQCRYETLGYSKYDNIEEAIKNVYDHDYDDDDEYDRERKEIA